MGKLLGSAKAEHLPWKAWKRRLALLLSVTMVANLGVIAPRAEVTQSSALVIEEIEELPEAVRKQQVTPGTKEEELNLPETLNVRVSSDLDTRASSSNVIVDMVMEDWREVSVDWVFDSADNEELTYNENVDGIYIFAAELDETGYSTEFVTLPKVTVEVKGNEDDVIIEEWDYNIELPSTETSAQSLMTMSLANGRVDLANGNHVKWIDRVDLPDYAVDFYNLLVEGSDNDGNADVLIDDRYFSRDNAVTLNSSNGRSSIFNAFIVREFTNLDHELGDDEISYTVKCIRAALDAFDRDYPEVFWLNGSSWMKIGGSRRTASGKTTYNYQIYFVTHSHQDTDSSMAGFDIRDDQYLSASDIKTDIVERNDNVNTILQTVTANNTADQVAQMNDWITKHNEYNSLVANGQSSRAPKSAWECTSALDGRIGNNGPVCEAYARALKVLCDRMDIPCVLVDGGARSYAADSAEPHMWNYVYLEDEGKWYAVDVTWNDPLGGNSGAVSGVEDDFWLFLGADAEVNDNWTFIQSHPAENLVSENGVQFTNGPVLSRESYVRKPASVITFTPNSQTVTYTGLPAVVTGLEMRIDGVEGNAGIINVTPSYSYRVSGSSYDFTPGLPTDAGVYEVRATIPSTDDYQSGTGTMTLTINKSTPVLTISNTYTASKVYDAQPFAAPGSGAMTVTGTTFDAVNFTWYRNTVSHANQLESAPSDAGNYVLVASVEETNNTEAASAAREVVIERRPVTVTADNKTKTYGTADPELTYTVSPSTPLPSGGSLNGALAREAGENVRDGGYAINQGTLTDDNNSNYRITFTPGVLTINKASRISAPEADSISQHQITLKSVKLDSVSNQIGTVQYGINNVNSQEGIRWQKDPEFKTIDGNKLEHGTTYYFFLKVEGNSNYEDSVSQAAALTTLKTRVAKPALEAGKTYVYTGEPITVSLTGFDETMMRIVGGNTGTNAGDYTVQIALTDTVHYAWEEEGETENSAPVSITWTIQKANQAAVTMKEVGGKTYGDPSFTLEAEGGTGGGQMVFSVPEGSKVLSISGNQASIIGAGTVKVSAVRQGDANHNDSAPASVDVAVAKKAVTVKAADKTKFVGKNNPELTLETPAEGVLVGDDGIDALGVTLTTTAAKDSPVGTYPITGTASDNTNYDVTVVPGTLTIAATPKYKVEHQEGITEVPEALKNNQDLNTPEKIEEAMKQSVMSAMSGVTSNQVVVYDVTLMYSTDDGATWVKATEDAFPEEGITVTLPYPSGTSSARYNFAVKHMLTTGDHAGEIETPEIQTTSNGIQFKVYSLSPIAVGYKRKSSGGSSGGGGGSSSGGGGSSSSGGGGGSSSSGGPSSGSSAGAWVADNGRWRYQYTNGTYAAGSTSGGQEYISWVQIKGVWWAFGADGYAKDGWVLDARTNLWYSIDINSGMRVGWYLDTDGRWYYLDTTNGNMLVGWLRIGGAWYYLSPVSEAGRPFGSMYHNETTPDGYFVREDGGWNGQ